jgi:histone H3/H4
VDEDVLKLISLATEIFINDLTNRAVYFTEYEKRKIMKVNMFKIKG